MSEDLLEFQHNHKKTGLSPLLMTTRMSWVYLMRGKSESEQIFKVFHNMIQNQFQTNIQVFRSDNGREYFNKILGKYFEDNGIIH